MAEGEELEAKPDDQEKAAQPKKHRPKGRSAGKHEADTGPGEDTAEIPDASSEEESLTPATETAGSRAEAEVGAPRKREAAPPETPPEPKPKSLIHLLRFERRVGRRRR